MKEYKRSQIELIEAFAGDSMNGRRAEANQRRLVEIRQEIARGDAKVVEDRSNFGADGD